MVNNTSQKTTQIFNLLKEYSFDVDAHSAEAVIEGWLQTFDFVWISHAITEALYQGRYKLVSVDQILKLWQRRGAPIRHFNREFETIVLGQSMLCHTATDLTRTGPVQPSQALIPNKTTASPAFSPERASDNAQQQHQAVSNLSFDIADNETDASSVSLSEEEVALVPNSQYRGQAPQDTTLTSWFQAEMPVTNFQAVQVSCAGELYHPEPIRPFVPKQGASSMHQRLKAVVKAGSSLQK